MKRFDIITMFVNLIENGVILDNLTNSVIDSMSTTTNFFILNINIILINYFMISLL